MEVLRNTVMSIAALIIISGAVELLVSGNGTRGFARFACGLLLMLVMLAPLYELLGIEPEEWAENSRQAMTRAEDSFANESLYAQQILRAAQAGGAQVRVEAVSYANGSVESVEMTLLEGDPDQAALAVCSTFGLKRSQIAFR